MPRFAAKALAALGIAVCASQAVADPGVLVLPAHLPAECFEQAARDYNVPAVVLVAIVRAESRGRNGAVGINRNGSRDIGVAQHNSKSWVPYFKSRYGIDPEDLRTNACQSIRAGAYALRSEQNTRACKGRDIWCGVGRYHHPSNAALREPYVANVKVHLDDMLKQGRF